LLFICLNILVFNVRANEGRDATYYKKQQLNNIVTLENMELYERKIDSALTDLIDLASGLILLQCTLPTAKTDVKNSPNLLNILQCGVLPVLNKTGPDNNNLSHWPSDNQLY